MPQRQRRLLSLALVTAALVGCGVVLWQTAWWTERAAVEEIRARSTHTLALVVENLRGELNKHQLKVELLAAHPDITSALIAPGDTAAIGRLNRELERITRQTGALDTYVMDRAGTTIAASNWAAERTFIGRNFSFRPYFKMAMTGELGRYFGVGTTSGERGYYFAQPVESAGSIIGAVVVKMDVGRLEASWRSDDSEILVHDDADVVFLSSRAGWRFRTLRPLSGAQAARLDETRRYFGKTLRPLGLVQEADGDLVRLPDVTHVSSSPPGATAGTAPDPSAGKDEAPPPATTPARRYLTLAVPMAEAGWTVRILADTGSVPRQVNVAVAVAGLLLVTIALAWTGFHQRRRRLGERLAIQEAARAELEEKVSSRTRDLEEVNAALRSEIVERERTELRLRQTQADLIQASKLAALGQLAAGLSHELNQPLAAIRSYAENARAFLGRGQPEPVAGNLAGIAELTERMARIIKNLRTYARKEPMPSRPTALAPAIAGALALLERRICEDGVLVVQSLPDEPLIVVAGDVRLQQVFVNLISNALDAMRGSDRRHLRIAAETNAGEVIVRISDTGTGIPEEAMTQIFDPFYSTKEVGDGTGLGLSITYGIVQQFGGSIAAGHAKGGGAEFTLRLRRADLPCEAAA